LLPSTSTYLLPEARGILCQVEGQEALLCPGPHTVLHDSASGGCAPDRHAEASGQEARLRRLTDTLKSDDFMGTGAFRLPFSINAVPRF
jgi:hypothetical protein